MKRTILILTLLTSFCFISYSQNYKKPAVTILEDGSVMQAGVKVGSVDNEGNIKDIKGAPVAKVVEDKSGEFDLVDALGNKMGHIMSNGNFVGKDGKKIYMLNEPNPKGECAIVDSDGKVVGTTFKNYKRQGECATYCVKCGLLK